MWNVMDCPATRRDTTSGGRIRTLQGPPASAIIRRFTVPYSPLSSVDFPAPESRPIAVAFLSYASRPRRSCQDGVSHRTYEWLARMLGHFTDDPLGIGRID